jgi:arylsulfatase A-like enzyme
MLLTVAVAAATLGQAPGQAPVKPSVMHMVFDDFRPDLPFYGQKFVHAPNLWAFANKSLVFDRAYCQIAVCSPSRNSFMTGRRPNGTMVWNFYNHFREASGKISPPFCPSSSSLRLLLLFIFFFF